MASLHDPLHEKKLVDEEGTLPMCVGKKVLGKRPSETLWNIAFETRSTIRKNESRGKLRGRSMEKAAAGESPKIQRPK